MNRAFLKRIYQRMPSVIGRPLRAVYMAYMHTVHRDYSSDGETIAIRKIMKSFPERTFVEIGANDGVRISSTFGLVLDGWSGLSVEANPATFARLQRNLSNYSSVKTVCCAAAPTSGKVKLFFGKNDPEGFLCTISTEENKWYEENRDTSFVEVDGIPLTDLLLQYAIAPRFGLLLIDAEGMDLEILQTIDFKLFRPRLLITEHYAPKDQKKFELLKASGYRLHSTVGANTFWIDEKKDWVAGK